MHEAAARAAGLEAHLPPDRGRRRRPRRPRGHAGRRAAARLRRRQRHLPLQGSGGARCSTRLRRRLRRSARSTPIVAPRRPAHRPQHRRDGLRHAPIARLSAGTATAPVAIIGSGGVGKAIGFALASCGVTRVFRIFDIDERECARARPRCSRACARCRRSQPASRQQSAAPAGIVNGTPDRRAPEPRHARAGRPPPQAGMWVADRRLSRPCGRRSSKARAERRARRGQ